MSLLWLLCHYYITFLCRFNARPKKLLNLLWICEFRFKCSMTSLAVVFFLRPFLWGILAFRIVETVCKPFTLFHSKWETKLRYQGQLNHPTPRMTKKWLCCILPHVPWAPLHPTISPSFSPSFIVFKMVCHFSMVTSQKHPYTNKPTSQYSFIIAYVAILMAREGTCVHILLQCAYPMYCTMP